MNSAVRIAHRCANCASAFRFKRIPPMGYGEDRFLGEMRGSLSDSTIVSTSKTEGGDGDHVPQRLTVGTGQSVATHLLPREGTLIVGRAPDSSIRVEDTSVSRQHVRLHLGAMVQIEDLGSANGTKI